MDDENSDDFYEDDEPIEHVRARRHRPFDVVTASPARAVTMTLYVGSGAHWTTSRSGARNEPACR